MVTIQTQILRTLSNFTSLQMKVRGHLPLWVFPKSLLQILLWEPGRRRTSCLNPSYLVWASSEHRKPAGPVWKYSCCFTRRNFVIFVSFIIFFLLQFVTLYYKPFPVPVSFKHEINKHDVSSTIPNSVYFYRQWTMWMPYCTCVAYLRPGVCSRTWS